MERQKFNPLEWLDSPKPTSLIEAPTTTEYAHLEEVEIVLKQIEQKQIDITAAYNDWLSIGFAFADAFGESGRSLFHRVSRFYHNYTSHDCDNQYDKCLKSSGYGITLKTFFYLANVAGIEIKPKNEIEEMMQIVDPEKASGSTKPFSLEKGIELQIQYTFPDSLFSQLPDFLQNVVKIATFNEERDILLLGSIVVISACLPRVSGIYDGNRVFPNLYLFVTAKASAGKGRLVLCRQLVSPIHKELREQAKLHKQQYELDLAEYEAKKGKAKGIEKPAKPPEKMLFIPANNSSTGAYQLLGDNDGRGLIFESEGDTLAHAFKSDFGDYSDGFRKAFQHETISYYRRTDREIVDIETPCLSVVLSGTPKQISTLIPNAENGLFSRIIFYYMNVRPQWKDVFASKTNNGLHQYFETLGNEFYVLYKLIMLNEPLEFNLTDSQQEEFNRFFEQVQEKYLTLIGLDYIATIRRLGLIAYRISMILSALRIMETGEISTKLVCEDRDFQSALAMVKVLVKHAGKVFSELPHEASKPRYLNKKEKFLKALPLTFNRKKYLEVAAAMSIAAKTADGFIKSFVKSGLVHHETRDTYLNISLVDSKESKDCKDN